MQGLTAGPGSIQNEQHSNIYQGALKLPQLEEHLRETDVHPAAPQPVCRRHSRISLGLLSCPPDQQQEKSI